MDDERRKMRRRENVYLAQLWAGLLLIFGPATQMSTRTTWADPWPWLELVGIALVVYAGMNSPHPDRAANRH